MIFNQIIIKFKYKPVNLKQKLRYFEVHIFFKEYKIHKEIENLGLHTNQLKQLNNGPDK